MRRYYSFTLPLLGLVFLGLITGACGSKSPEDLPKYKKKFRAQIASFENQKQKADEQVEDGVSTLNNLQQALENAKNVDSEFKAVYGKWEKVDKQVESLNKEYEGLKQDAENLFGAMERQTAGLNDEKTRTELNNALKTSRSSYEQTLSKTAAAIEQLRSLHGDAVDVIKALEVAIAIGQIAEINTGLQNIESKVANIMKELNATVKESKDLYESRMGGISG
ncbi:MAG: DUF2959 family protein [Bacteroidota bacterium]